MLQYICTERVTCFFSVLQLLKVLSLRNKIWGWYFYYFNPVLKNYGLGLFFIFILLFIQAKTLSNLNIYYFSFTIFNSQKISVFQYKAWNVLNYNHLSFTTVVKKKRVFLALIQAHTLHRQIKYLLEFLADKIKKEFSFKYYNNLSNRMRNASW